MAEISFGVVLAVGAFVVALVARRRWIAWLIPAPFPIIGLVLDAGQPSNFDMPHFFTIVGLYVAAFLWIGITTGAMIRLVAYRGSDAGWDLHSAAFVGAAWRCSGSSRATLQPSSIATPNHVLRQYSSG